MSPDASEDSVHASCCCTGWRGRRSRSAAWSARCSDRDLSHATSTTPAANCRCKPSPGASGRTLTLGHPASCVSMYLQLGRCGSRQKPRSVELIKSHGFGRFLQRPDRHSHWHALSNLVQLDQYCHIASVRRSHRQVTKPPPTCPAARRDDMPPTGHRPSIATPAPPLCSARTRRDNGCGTGSRLAD
jgi:hypothetical protein